MNLDLPGHPEEGRDEPGCSAFTRVPVHPGQPVYLSLFETPVSQITPGMKYAG